MTPPEIPTGATRTGPWWREAAWLLLVALAVATVLRVVWPYLRIVGLDLRALAESERVAIRNRFVVQDRVVDWAVFALRYLALPWLLVVASGLLLQARAVLRPGSRTLGDGPGWLRWTLGLIAVPPALLAIVPLALGLSVWLAMEIDLWVLDEDSNLPFLAFGYGTTLLASGLALAALALTLRVLRPAGPAIARARRSSARRVLTKALVLSVVALNLPPGVLLLIHAARLWPARLEIDLYERRCGECHSDGAPLFFVEPPKELRKRLILQKIPEKAKLSPDEHARIEAFLIGMRSHPDALVFLSRCGQCHPLSHLAWDDRHVDDWRMITERVARYSPFAYHRAAVDQIVDHLAEARSNGDEGPGVSGEAYRDIRLATRICTACHFLSRNAEANAGLSREAASALVRRMSNRLYQPLDAEQVARIADAYRAIVSSAASLKRLVPHDRPILDEPARIPGAHP